MVAIIKIDKTNLNPEVVLHCEDYTTECHNEATHLLVFMFDGSTQRLCPLHRGIAMLDRIAGPWLEVEGSYSTNA